MGIKRSFFPLLFTVSLLILTTYSCSSLKKFSSFEKPTMKVSDVRVTNLSLRDVELTFDFEVFNPNNISGTINAFDYDFLLSNQSFIKGEKETNTEIGAKSSSSFQLPISVSYNDLFDIFSTLKDEDNVPYTLQVNTFVDIPLLGKSEIPISQSGVIPIVKIPTLSVKDMELSSITFSQARLNLNIEIQNPNSFSINTEGLNYNLKLNDLNTLSGKIQQTQTIEKKSSTQISIPVNLNFLDLGIGVYRMISSSEALRYTFDGDVTLGADLPLFKTSTFNFEKSGSVDILK